VYEYNAEVKKVVDGDSLHLEIDLGLETYRLINVRLAHVDCPEMNTEAGKAAKQFTHDWIVMNGPTFKVHTTKDKKEKYGRYLVDVFAKNGECLNVELRTHGHARGYEGGAR